MSDIWRYLLRENPMQIETTRAIRRLTAPGNYTAAMQKTITRILFGLLYLLYAWFLVMIVAYKEDVSEGILFFEFGLLTLFIPGSLYAAISGERERLTWDSLILTRLSPARILVGKLFWRLAMVGIILLVFLPPLLLTHYVSHFTPAYTLWNLLYLQFLIAAWCVFLAAFTLYVLAKTKRSVASLALVTVTLLACLGLLPTLMNLFGIREEAPDFWRFSPTWMLTSLLLHLNPAMAILELENGTLNATASDFWRDCLNVGLDSKGFGIYTLAPFLYLTGAGLYIAGTLKALARLGMPLQATRRERER